MNTPSTPQPERPPAGGTSASADDDVLLAPDQSESALRPDGGSTDRPDRPDGSSDDEYDDDDEYEPL